ncbi:LamB/YcsF family protein [Mycetocola reblochoni]|uniref:LamB/YcsF family protein n=1 Tax=Mycetocola reblochoni TaxID=331618 RepID=UPI001FED1C48|nr:5-oxoprolinase subunit PxpA [Mycetocola reblochoni]
MTISIDLVADVGESYGAYRLGDDSLLDSLSSANVACGFHAGDPVEMDRIVGLCVDRGVAVGAHPGFRDVVGFGRRRIQLSRAEVRAETLYQIGALSAFTRRHGTDVQHVTPHGALGNLCVEDELYAAGVLDAVIDVDPSLPVVTQEGVLAELARSAGVPVAITAMADRGYRADGSLVPRSEPGAVIHDRAALVERAVRMVRQRSVTSVEGTEVALDCATVLLHGDGDDAAPVAAAIRSALLAGGVEIAPIREVLARSAAAGDDRPIDGRDS